MFDQDLPYCIYTCLLSGCNIPHKVHEGEGPLITACGFNINFPSNYFWSGLFSGAQSLQTSIFSQLNSISHEFFSQWCWIHPYRTIRVPGKDVKLIHKLQTSLNLMFRVLKPKNRVFFLSPELLRGHSRSAPTPNLCTSVSLSTINADQWRTGGWGTRFMNMDMSNVLNAGSLAAVAPTAKEQQSLEERWILVWAQER